MKPDLCPCGLSLSITEETDFLYSDNVVYIDGIKWLLSIVSAQVRVHSGASEVSVVYRVDEFSIELSVCLPDNYPLQPPTIREGKRARIDMAQWRKWMLQLNVFVANQVGPST